jgi:glycosyltransferase involved in cell wall biosynthesis
MKDKILFIGPLNFGNQPLGGDQFKNNLLLNSLIDIYSVKSIDTCNIYRNPLKLCVLFYFIFINNFDRIILSASTISAIKLLSVIKISKKKSEKTVYWVIGGELPEVLRHNFRLISLLNGFKQIGVQTVNMCNELFELGLRNVCTTPNFKNFSLNSLSLRTENFIFQKNEYLRIVFISRISPLKGVDVILNLMEQKSELERFGKVKIDFFGPIENDYKDRFLGELDKYENLTYRGYLNFSEDIDGKFDMLNNQYDVFLFPTRWPSEGFPGVLIDAMCSGLATIATDWNYNNEVIQNGVNGLLLENGTFAEIINAINFYQLNSDLLYAHRLNALKIADKFHLSNNMQFYIASLN